MNHPNPVLRRFNQRVYHVCVIFTDLLLVALVINNLMEMAARGFWNTSIGWVFEVNLLIAIWLYFVGIYQVYFRRGDISVDVIMRRASLKAQRLVAIAIDIVIVATLVMISWYAVQLILVQWPFKTPGLRLPNPMFTAPVLIGSVFMALTMFERLLQRLSSPDHMPSGIAGMEV